MNRISVFFVVLGFLFIPIFGSAQVTFQRVYWDEALRDMHVEAVEFPGGGYIIGASASSYIVEENNIELMRTDQIGDTMWTVEYGESGVEECVADLSIDAYGRIGVVATMDYWSGPNPPQDDIVVLCTDSFGVLLWSVVVDINGIDKASSIDPTDDGGYIVGGTAGNYSSAFVLKLSSTGGVQWIRSFSLAGSMNVTGGRTIACGNGEFAMICELKDSSYNRSTVITRLSASGNVVWQQQYESGNWFAGVGIGELFYGDLVFCCRDDYSTWNTKMYSVTRITPSGSVVWSTICAVSVNFDFFPEDMKVGIWNDIWLCGGLLDYSGRGGFVTRFSIFGAHLATAVYSNGPENWFNSLAPTNDGGCVLSGTLDTTGWVNSSSQPSCYIAKADGSGISGCNSQMMLPYVSSQAVAVSTINLLVDSAYSASVWQLGPTYAFRRIIELCPAVVSVPESEVFSVVRFNSFTSMLILAEIEAGSLVCIYDVTGNLIQTAVAKAQYMEISCRDFACGVYAYSILGNDGVVTSGKFLKN